VVVVTSGSLIQFELRFPSDCKGDSPHATVAKIAEIRARRLAR
jgi:hypothetical protein